MATTTGLVQQLKWNPALGAVFAWIGPTPQDTRLRYVLFRRDESSPHRSIRRNLVFGLTMAQWFRLPVVVTHGDGDAEISTLTIPPAARLYVVDRPIHLDFFSVTADGIPGDAVLVFTSAGGATTQVVPDLIRPQLAFVAKLPTTVPLGPGTLRGTSASGWSTLPVAIDVLAGPPRVKRVIQPGPSKPNPFTFVIAGDPALWTPSTNTYAADPVMANRSGYHDSVLYGLRNILTLPEDCFRANDRDVHIRFVSIFDSSLSASDQNSLAYTSEPNIIGPRRSQMAAFARRYGETADLLFAVTGDPIYTRASANLTVDDDARPGVTFTYDGASHVHRRFTTAPGCAAVPWTAGAADPTWLHELGHAVSSTASGSIFDLYVDGGPGGFQENKKFRAAAPDPIPTSFAALDGTIYASDPTRDALGYPPEWRSYHAQLLDATRPNLMDNFWYSTPYTAVRFDGLTHRFVIDRLSAKFFR